MTALERFAGRRRWRPRSPAAAGINLTSLLDVFLQLIIFFLLASPLVASNVLPHIRPPESTYAAPSRGEGDIIAVDENDRVTFNGDATAMEDLPSRLRAAVTLAADAGSSLGVTVRILDLCRDAGVEVRVVAIPKRG